jgi:hypothetical protein
MSCGLPGQIRFPSREGRRESALKSGLAADAPELLEDLHEVRRYLVGAVIPPDGRKAGCTPGSTSASPRREDLDQPKGAHHW